jgi:hypothetical protein
MNISRLMFWIMSGALVLGVHGALASNPAQKSEVTANTVPEGKSYVDASGVAKPSARLARLSKSGIQRKTTKAKGIPLPSSAAKANRLKQPLSSLPGAKYATTHTSNHSRLVRPAAVGGIRSAQKIQIGNALRPQTSTFPASSRSLDNPRHRTPNPAAIGGPASSRFSRTAAINGSTISCKP